MTTGPIRAVRRAWQRIREPRVLKVLFWVVYLLVVVAGAVTLASPPDTIAGALGPVLIVAPSVMWLLAGIGGMATVLTGWWRVERSAVALALLGLSIYAVVLAVLHTVTPVSRLTQLAWVAIAAMVFLIRLALIRGHDFEPRG
jgi:hypothetical protein